MEMPWQYNGVDCGVFVLQNAETFFLNHNDFLRKVFQGYKNETKQIESKDEKEN